MYCTHCGQKFLAEASFCSNCGKPAKALQAEASEEISATRKLKAPTPMTFPASPPTLEISPSDMTEEDLTLFVGPNADRYRTKWAKLNQAKPRSFKSWNWPAFLFNVYWLAYRKMYLQSALWGAGFLIAGIFFKGFLLGGPIVLGILANGQYYSFAQLKIEKIKAANQSQEAQRAAIVRGGGTSIWAMAASIVIYVILALAETYITM